jgi:N-acetylmuramoyl-L-alanine amidase
LRCIDSDILFAVRKRFPFAILLAVASAWTFAARVTAHTTARAVSCAQDQAHQQASPSQQQGSPASASPAPTEGAQSSAPARQSVVVVLDPAHGGTDTGARGENNIAEKDVVLGFAREIRGELESLGYRVVLTRNDDSNPSYDDRAATANANRNAVFVSIHLASTGAVGTARAYYYQYWTSFATAAQTTPSSANAPAPGAVTWEEAQRPYADQSRRFAEVLQGELSTRFSGSASAPTGTAVRGLRSIEAPAVVVELSSTAVSDPSSLTAMAAPLASAIVHAVELFRPAGALVTP